MVLRTAIGFSGAWGSCLYVWMDVCVCVCVCVCERDKVIKKNRIRQERQQITELNSQTESLAL